MSEIFSFKCNFTVYGIKHFSTIKQEGVQNVNKISKNQMFSFT